MPFFYTRSDSHFHFHGVYIADMFVIVQCLENLDEVEDETTEEKVARAMRHAGVSITVTSFTDAATFFIGATTVSWVTAGTNVLCVLVAYHLYCTFLTWS